MTFHHASTFHHHAPSHHHHAPSHHHQHHRSNDHQTLPIPPLHNNNNNNNHNHNHRHRHQDHHHSSSSSASIRGCCCCLILLFSFLALLVVTVVLVIVLAVKPKKPQFDLQQVGVQYINLAAPVNGNAPTTTASLSLAIRMMFTAKNENKVGIKYGVSTFNIMYRGIPLGRGTVPGFYQPAHSVRQVQTTVTVDRVNLLQADAADLVRDASLNDRVELRIMGDVNAKIRVMGITSPSVQVSIEHFIFLLELEILRALCGLLLLCFTIDGQTPTCPFANIRGY